MNEFIRAKLSQRFFAVEFDGQSILGEDTERTRHSERLANLDLRFERSVELVRGQLGCVARRPELWRAGSRCLFVKLGWCAARAQISVLCEIAQQAVLLFQLFPVSVVIVRAVGGRVFCVALRLDSFSDLLELLERPAHSLFRQFIDEFDLCQ